MNLTAIREDEPLNHRPFDREGLGHPSPSVQITPGSRAARREPLGHRSSRVLRQPSDPDVWGEDYGARVPTEGWGMTRCPSQVPPTKTRLSVMQNGALIAGLVSALALVLSLLFLARQTRESARQSVLANQLAGLEAKSEIYTTVDRILYKFLEFPHLRKYFYEGIEIPEFAGVAKDGDVRDQVLTFAELFCDAIERGLDTYRSVEPAANFRSPMETYANDIVTGSPAIRYLVHVHPGWWPNLEAWIERQRTN